MQKGAEATVQCASATQRLAMAMTAMSEISQGVVPTRSSILAITQSPRPLAHASTPAPGESLAGSARSVWSEMAIEGASSATSERPEKETEPVVSKPVELAKSVANAKPAAPTAAITTVKPAEVSKPVEPARLDKAASVAPVSVPLSAGPVRATESRQSQPVGQSLGQLESAKAALLAKEAALRKQIESLRPVTPARSSSVPAKPNELASANGISASVAKPAQPIKPARQSTPSQPMKPSEQAKAVMAAKIAALKKKAEEARVQPASANGDASPSVPQRQAETVRPGLPPKPAAQATPSEQPKPVQQPQTPQPPRSAAPPKPAEQPRSTEQSRPVDQSKPAGLSRPFEIPRKFEVPRQTGQARASSHPSLDSLRKRAETSGPAAPPKPADTVRSNGSNRTPNSTVSQRPAESARRANATNAVEPPRSAISHRPNRAPNKPPQPADSIIHPSRKTRFGPEIVPSTPERPGNGSNTPASIPTGPKSQWESNAQPPRQNSITKSNNSNRKNNAQPSAPQSETNLSKSFNTKSDPVCRHCFGQWGWFIRTTDKPPPCVFDKSSQRMKCDHCFEQRLECVLVREHLHPTPIALESSSPNKYPDPSREARPLDGHEAGA